MSDALSLVLEPRTVVRKGLNKLRSEGLIPAIIHDHGKESVAVTVPYLTIVKTYKAAGKHHPLALKVGSEDYLAMIKDIDFEPKKQQIRHVVFNAIKQNEKVEAEIPIEFEEGIDIPAERSSLMVLRQLDHVEVEAFPRNLPDVIKIDPSSLVEVGDRLTVADLKAPEGVTILTEPEAQIAIVEMPKDQVAEADAAAAELAADAETPEAEGVTAEHGEDTPQDTQAEETKPGGKLQKEPKPNAEQS